MRFSRVGTMSILSSRSRCNLNYLSIAQAGIVGWQSICPGQWVVMLPVGV